MSSHRSNCLVLSQYHTMALCQCYSYAVWEFWHKNCWETKEQERWWDSWLCSLNIAKKNNLSLADNIDVRLFRISKSNSELWNFFSELLIDFCFILHTVNLLITHSSLKHQLSLFGAIISYTELYLHGLVASSFVDWLNSWAQPQIVGKSSWHYDLVKVSGIFL